jgi:hypothetical protein
MNFRSLFCKNCHKDLNVVGQSYSTTYGAHAINYLPTRIRFFVASASGRLLPNLNIQECGPRLCMNLLVQNAFRNVEYATRKYLQQDICCLCVRAESIEWLIEDQAFSPPSHPLPSASCLSFQSSCVSPVELTYVRGGGGGGGAKSYDGEKAWSSINHSILSALVQTAKPGHLLVPAWSIAYMYNCTVAEGGRWTKSKLTKIFAWPKVEYFNCPMGVLEKRIFYEVPSYWWDCFALLNLHD